MNDDGNDQRQFRIDDTACLLRTGEDYIEEDLTARVQ